VTAKATKTNGRLSAIGGEAPTNGAAEAIEMTTPYVAHFAIQGVADLLFHRWNCEAVEEKANAAKGSKAKKTDNIESYVYRDDAGELCLPRARRGSPRWTYSRPRSSRSPRSRRWG
jgi:hypothetical protein